MPRGLVELAEAAVVAGDLVGPSPASGESLPASFSSSFTSARWAAMTEAPMEAVCCEPPARTTPGRVESP